MFMLIYCRVLRLFGLGSSIWEVMLYNAIRCYHALSAHHSNLRVVMHYNATRCCHALQCQHDATASPKQSRFTIPMTMCCHALQCNTVLSCFTMQHGAVMHYNASTMRRHHQTVAVYNTYDYVVKHERNTVLLCGNRSTTYYVLFSHRATCC